MPSKKTTLINEDLLSTPSAVTEAGRTRPDPATPGTDLFRKEFGSWQSLGEGIVYVPRESSKIRIDEISTPEYKSGEFLQKIKQTIRISEKADIGTNPGAEDVWDSYVKSLAGPNTKMDNVASFRNPPTSEEMLTMDIDPVGSIAGVSYTYNFNDIPYENLLATVRNHTVIPSMYSMLSASTDAGDNILRGGTVRRLRRNRRRPARRKKFEIQMVPMESTNLLTEYRDSKFLFPMYNEVIIPLPRHNEVSNAVMESDLGSILTRDVHSLDAPASSVKTERVNYSLVYYTSAEGRVVNSFSANATSIDLMEWVNYDAGGLLADLPDNAGFLGAPTDSSMLACHEGPELVRWSALQEGIEIFKSHMEDIASSHRRDFNDLIAGKTCYTETFMYKVEKFLGTNVSNASNILQTFHVMNKAELREIMAAERQLAFVDTQVKYGETYSYVVTGYQIVVGSKYNYSNIQTYYGQRLPDGSTTNSAWATLDVEIEPCIKLIEVPLFMSTGKIIDFPPLEPEVSFYPYKGQPNKLLYHFNTGTGQVDQEPIAITLEDAENHAQITLNQLRTDGKITFKTDDANVAYQVYRTSAPPLSYDDFSNSLLTTVTTDSINPRINLIAGSTSVVINQAPNRKYYYMFRSVDYHGGLSNPSPVYEIELYNDGGVGYPLIRHYDFGSIDPKTTTKSARKIIQIIPRISQAYLNEEASGLVDETGVIQRAAGNRNIFLGLQEEALFGKRFKVRLVSKSTGKKVDINIDFKTKRIRGVIE